MLVPAWFNKELQLINEMYFAIWNPKIKRWQIREWRGVYPKSPRLWKEFSKLIFTIYKDDPNWMESGKMDGGHQGLDMRTIRLMRESHWTKLRIKEFIKMLDESDDKREMAFEKATRDIGRYGAMQIWKHFKSHSVDLGGK